MRVLVAAVVVVLGAGVFTELIQNFGVQGVQVGSRPILRGGRGP